ncbi:MAG: winged helix-turn-helix domain-containing protein, partial [Cellulosilyticaceae bacterium]
MSQKALVISINDGVCQWLLEQLQQDGSQREAISDLLEGIEGLRQGEYHSLIINTPQEGTQPEAVENKLKCGELVIDGGNRSVYYKEQFIQLTPKEFDILYLLANNRGRVYTKDQIY